MPTRKQRRRELKAKRHEYEFVYVDADGNEVDDAPEDEPRPGRERGKDAAARNKKAVQQRGGRALRKPPVPSWNRAFKRGGLLGVVVFALFSFTAKGNYLIVLPTALLYALMFVPFTYFIDRFAYRRWQAREAGGAPPVRKR